MLYLYSGIKERIQTTTLRNRKLPSRRVVVKRQMRLTKKISI